MHQANLKKVSNIFIIVGAFAFSFALYSWMNLAPKKTATPRLKQSNSSDSTGMFMATDGSVDIASAANVASMFIWGLVLAKAKNGLEAAESKDSSKVGGILSKATSLIMLVVVSAVCKLIATMS